jgi:chromosome segregation ATPase
MRNALQYLLIIFALGLCALVAFQWHREGQLSTKLRTLQDTARNQQTLRESLQSAEAKAAQAESQLRQVRETSDANTVAIARLNEELNQARAAYGRLTAEADAYKSALANANTNIITLNESLQTLADERNAAAVKYNELAETYNALVKKWNAEQMLLAPPKTRK